MEEDSIPTTVHSTLYPKIHKLSDLVHNINRYEHANDNEGIISLTGTVKLHGTHADIVFASATSEGYRLQSRNKRDLYPGKEDNAGYASYVESIGKQRILNLREKIVARYRELNPEVPVEGEVILAGEWCGKGIQKGVGIAEIPPFLVIISISINNEWVQDSKYEDIHDEEARIFNISRAGFYHHELRLDDVQASEVAIKQWVDAVDKECPFAKALGVTGRGEGIVWKADHLCGNATFWFKSKADAHAVSHSDKLPPSAVDLANKERVANFAKAIVTEVRMEQGWQLLEKKEASHTGQFLSWVTKDCFEEEQREMEQLSISRNQLKPAIIQIAKAWFQQRLKE